MKYQLGLDQHKESRKTYTNTKREIEKERRERISIEAMFLLIGEKKIMQTAVTPKHAHKFSIYLVLSQPNICILV